MADLIFPSDFKQIDAINKEDVLLINDASATDDNNFVATAGQILNFLNQNSGQFKGIAYPKTEYQKTNTDEFYLAFQGGEYLLNDNNGRRIILTGKTLVCLQSKEGADSWESIELVDTSQFANNDEVQKQISALQPDNYLQKNAMQDEEINSFDIARITEEDANTYFRAYDNTLTASERLSFSLVKGAVQTYIKQQMALYPTFQDMYNAIGSVMGSGSSDSLAKQVSILQAELTQIAVPFAKQEQVQVKYSFNHVPRVLILNAEQREVFADVVYNVADKFVTITLNPDEVAEGVIYLI